MRGRLRPDDGRGGAAAGPAKPAGATTAFTRSGQTAERTITLPASPTASSVTLTWDDPGAKFAVVAELIRPELRLLRPKLVRGRTFVTLRIAGLGRPLTVRLRIRAAALARATTVTTRMR